VMSEKVTSNEIIAYIHCKECIEEIDRDGLDVAPREYISLEIGINIDNQLLIGCVRHNEHVGAFTLHEQINMQIMDKGCDCCE